MRDGRVLRRLAGSAAIFASERCRGDLVQVATQNENRSDRPHGVKPRHRTQSRACVSARISAGMVAAGILLSRIAGLIRESIFAHYLGNSAAADAFKAGFRIPNILQNLLGEGVLSASFIPVYSRLLGEGDDEDGRPAGMGASARCSRWPWRCWCSWAYSRRRI